MMNGNAVDLKLNSLDDMPLVSVIMNCYNCETYLKEAIDSVYAQTYPNWEIIFWDNASTDRSAEIALSYDDRLRYFRGSETVLLGAARNKAVEQARGELIAFLDCDDIWMQYTLTKLVKAITSGEYALAYGGVEKIDENGDIFGYYVPTYSSGNLLGELLVQFDINVPATILNKRFLKASGLTFDPSVKASEEYCLFMQLAAKHLFCVIHETVAKYRVHTDSLTNKTVSKWAEERVYTLDLLQKQNPNISVLYRKELREAYARAFYYKARYYFTLGDRRKARKELRKVAFVNYKYFFLFCFTFFPNVVWHHLHKFRFKRGF